MAVSEHWKIKRETAEYYDRIARVYDALYGYEQSLKIREILKKISINVNDVMLDVGCGTGILFKHIGVLGSMIVGVDISLGALERAKRLIEKERLENVHLIRADADFLPFRDEVFDKVFAITLIQNSPEPQLTLREMMRVAKGSSEIIVTGLKKIYTRDVFMNVLMEAGLQFSLLNVKEDVKCHISICNKSRELPAKSINNRAVQIVSEQV